MLAVSGVQIATLVVAGVAALASIAGVVLSTYLTSKSDQRKWLRDSRLKALWRVAGSAQRGQAALIEFVGSYDAGGNQSQLAGAIKESVDLYQQSMVSAPHPSDEVLGIDHNGWKRMTGGLESRSPVGGLS